MSGSYFGMLLPKCRTSTKRGGRVGQGSLVQVQGRGAGSVLLLLVVGIVMVVDVVGWCSGGVRGLVSLVVPDNGRVYVSYRGPANLPLHAFEDMDRMLLVIMLFLPTSAHWLQQLAQ